MMSVVMCVACAFWADLARLVRLAAIVDVVRLHSFDRFVQEQGCACLAALCSARDDPMLNKDAAAAAAAVVAAGGHEAVITGIQTVKESAVITTHGAACLANMCAGSVERKAKLVSAGTVQVRRDP